MTCRIKEAERRIKELEEALEQYADEDNWVQGLDYAQQLICELGPEVAQQALQDKEV